MPERKTGRAPPKPARRRRDPDEARAMILAAAERVFAEHVPDVVGLKEIARAAEVSHALVSHYFGSYEALVEATLEGRLAAVRERVVAAMREPGIPRNRLLDLLADVVQDPLTLRLVGWAMLTGRTRRSDFFSARTKALRQIADAVEMVRAREGFPAVPRGDIEFVLVAAITMMLGFGLGREAFVAALGHPTTGPALAAADAEFRSRVRDLLELYMSSRK